MRVLRDLEYSHRQALDVYVPDVPQGAVLLLHGGWPDGDKSDEAVLAEHLCRSGILVFSANFGLDRSGPSGSALSDTIAALGRIRASEFDLDPDRIAVMGVGTGGTVAIEVGLKEGIPVVGWSALIDFKSFMDSSATLGDSDHLRDYYGVNWETIKEAGEQIPFLRGGILALVANNLSLLAAASPLSRVSPSAGRMLLFNSTNELVPATGASMLQQAMMEADVSCTVDILDGTAHGSEYLLQALPATIRFLTAAYTDESVDAAEHAHDEQDDYLVEALMETFPGSDPISPGHVAH
ncbi:alpha/beta hydrolase [Rhizobium sp.]|uniref:alpha/beta hydrolase family protein n=1 Tax=Rhizobium sp. TaxID=391 RepID=UPI0028ABC14E